MTVVSLFPANALTVESLDLLFSITFSEAIPSPGQTSPGPSASPHKASAPAPRQLAGPSLNLLQFINIFLLLRCLKLDTIFQKESKKCQEQHQNFSQSTSCASVNTAQMLRYCGFFDVSSELIAHTVSVK